MWLISPPSARGPVADHECTPTYKSKRRDMSIINLASPSPVLGPVGELGALSFSMDCADDVFPPIDPEEGLQTYAATFVNATYA